MDRSELRRGNPSVHVKYGENVAILSGDVMSIIACDLINRSPGVVLNTVLDIFTKTAIQVCEGQQLDMNFEKLLTVTEEAYLSMIELKTAVLIAASLKIGALLGGSSQKDAEDLYEFGRNLGIAFQLQDDLLDTYGDPSVVGKKVGTDIVDNKKTYLMISALDKADSAQREALIQWLNATKFNKEEKIKAVTALYDNLNIKQFTKKRIQEFYNKALANLEHLNRPADRKTELFNFASFLKNRSR